MDALASLHKVCGEEHVRPGAAADAVDGLVPAYVAAPASTDEIRELVLVARDAGLRIGVRGAGSKLGWGMPPTGLDLLLDLSRQDRVLEHAAGDLVVRVEPGVRLVALREHLAPARQQLALDPPEPGATVGGVIGANASGPSRLLYGTSRDLLIGITVVLADVTVARAGGKVVKNVAGYDIGKLYIGAVGQHDRDADQQVASRAVEQPARTAGVGTDHPTDCRTRLRRIQGELLAGRRQLLPQRHQPHPGLDPDHQVPGGVFEHPILAGELEQQVQPRWRHSPAQLAAGAPNPDAQAGVAGDQHQLSDLVGGRRLARRG